MSKLPAIQFYPADWRKDPAVQSLGYHDRGVWFEILCLMHESEQRGKLLLNGKPMPLDALGRLLGLDNEVLNKTISTLISYGVAKVENETNIIYNKRMVEDECKRNQCREYGHQGGNPNLKANYKEAGFVYAIKRDSDGAIKIGIAQNVKNRFNKIKYSDKEDSFTLLGVMPSNDMGKDEGKLHSEFSNCNLIGEWFKIEGNNLEKLFTLMGINKGNKRDIFKGEERASSSSSSSSSNNNNIVADALVSKTKRFTKPTPQEVTDYAKEINYNLDGEQFCDFYESKGWLIGKTPVRDWKSCVRNWKRRNPDAVIESKPSNPSKPLRIARPEGIDDETWERVEQEIHG